MTGLTVNGCHYTVDVQGSGSPLVLLHGFTGSLMNWQVIARGLSRSYQVITLDLLGHGTSDAPLDPDRYAMPHAAADLAELFQALTADPLNLMGYSMGGRLALYIARHYPALVHTLILESASPGLADAAARQERRRSDEHLAQRIEQDGVRAFVDYWEGIPLFASQRHLPAVQRQRLRDQRLQNRPHGLANSLRGMGTGQQPSLWPELALIAQPTLLLAGQGDEKFTRIARQMAGRLPHATVQIIAGAGHTVHLEAPQIFEKQVAAFCAHHAVSASEKG